MLHVYCGNSPIRVRTAAYKKAAVYEEKGMHLVRIDADSYTEGVLANAAQSSTLFGETLVYFIDTPASEAAYEAEVQASLEALQDSTHIFIIVEENLLAGQKKIYTKFADSLEEIKEEGGRTFNVFALGDSLARKDKKMLWLGLCEAKEQGLSAEEIIGTLWWQLKTLRLAAITKSAAEAGMKDFPYNKAKRALAVFTQKELHTISQTLLLLYHQGHQGEIDIDLALEKWTLSI